MPASPLIAIQGAADIHSHILPGIDDGALQIENSVEMARVSISQGTTMMVATPHRFYGGRENSPELIISLVSQVQAEIDRTFTPGKFTVVCGQEIPLTLNTARELSSGETLAIGNSGKYALVEPPFDHLPEWIAEALGLIREAGIVPILAHPERNTVIQRNPALVREYVQAGAILQLTAMSVTGENGVVAQEAAFWMLQESLASVVASDCHSASWRPPLLNAAYQRIAALCGETEALALFVANPQRIAMSVDRFSMGEGDYTVLHVANPQGIATSKKLSARKSSRLHGEYSNE